MEKKLISIIVPIYNEEKHIEIFYKELCSVWENLRDKYNFELIFVNDGSTDNTDLEINKLAGIERRVKCIEFSRNFGKETAVSAGVFEALGEAAIIVDADLQHPLDLIPKFIRHWEHGAEVVVGVRKNNASKGFVRKFGSKLFVKSLQFISDSQFTANGTDYRLVDRKVINAFKLFRERNRITRGLFDWLGFKREVIYFEANERLFGESSFGIKKLLELTTHSFLSLSLFPLKLAGYLGFLITFISVIFGLFILTEQYIMRDPMSLHFSGPAQLAVLNMFLVGIVLVCMGFMALYIGNIHTEVLNRPFYVVRNKINFDYNFDEDTKQ